MTTGGTREDKQGVRVGGLGGWAQRDGRRKQVAWGKSGNEAENQQHSEAQRSWGQRTVQGDRVDLGS